MAITTTGTLPPPVQQDFALKLLSVPTPNMIHKIPAVKDRIKRNSGNIKRYRRYNPLPVSLVPLGTSGVTPPSTNLTAQDIDAKIDWYGEWLEINEQVVLNNQESKQYGLYKSSLIDLEAYGQSYGNKAQVIFC